MSKQQYRTCIRMSAKDYAMLKQKSRTAGKSANAWLMEQLETNSPIVHREQETREFIAYMDEVGREINHIARDFNSGYGTAEQLHYAVRELNSVLERIRELRKKGYIRVG